MKLCEKIAALRRREGMTQEELAEMCEVSRQSVSKWESDLALPELDKLLLLSRRFQVPVDVLLKEELALDQTVRTRLCGENALHPRQAEVYEGVIVKESLADDAVLDCVHVHRMELWNAGGRPRYWTMLFFTSGEADFPERLARALSAEDVWFADFKAGDEKYIVFRERILRYRIGNQAQKEQVCAECRKMGLADEQMHWPE